MKRMGSVVRLGAFALMLMTAAFRAPAAAPEPCSCSAAHQVRDWAAMDCASQYGYCAMLLTCTEYEGGNIHYTWFCWDNLGQPCTEQLMEWCE
jgi:hypothetical protein